MPMLAGQRRARGSASCRRGARNSQAIITANTPKNTPRRIAGSFSKMKAVKLSMAASFASSVPARPGLASRGFDRQG
jgi:hypothetical protein